MKVKKIGRQGSQTKIGNEQWATKVSSKLLPQQLSENLYSNLKRNEERHLQQLTSS